MDTNTRTLNPPFSLILFCRLQTNFGPLTRKKPHLADVKLINLD